MKILICLFLTALLGAFNVQANIVAVMTQGTATVTSTQAIGANTSRHYLLIQNRGAVALLVKSGSAHAGADVGISIPAQGNWEPIEVPIDAMFFKSASGTADWTIVEGK